MRVAGQAGDGFFQAALASYALFSDDQASAAPLGASPPSGRADLELRQSVARVERLADGLVYIVDVTNGGPGVASGVEVLDRLPSIPFGSTRTRR